MSQISELLESIKVVPATDDSEGNTCCKMKVSDYQKIFQAIELLKQQPTAGEFTKKYREKLKKQYPMCHMNCSEWPLLDIIDTAEARLKVMPDLIKACEKLMKAWLPPETHSICQLDTDMNLAYQAAVVAIAKAKKEG